MGIVLAILVFSLIVFIHELGHFLLAKANKIRVDEFSIGMGPRLFSFVKGETRYSLKLLPLGGSCMMGEDDVDDVGEGIYCDVRDYEQVSAVRDKAVSEFGGIDVMCNFAGGTAVRMQKVDKEKHPEFPDVPISVYDWGIDVNLKGPFYFAHAVLKQMREQGSGLIINIGSIIGQEGDAYGMDYSTSKAGLMFGLTKSIAQYGSKYGIRCVCVSPGPVLTRAAMANMKTLLGRAAEPQEIIDLILFIASEKGQYINGENIMIDGGRNAAGRRC